MGKKANLVNFYLNHAKPNTSSAEYWAENRCLREKKEKKKDKIFGVPN